MASIFGHAVAAIAIGSSFSKKMTNLKFWLLGILCAIIPDADVIGFHFNVKYNSFWGHRGFTHSLLFALLFGLFITLLFYRKFIFSKKGILYILFFSICTASHAILDALTTGGYGVAFFSPFDTSRYFFPWRPIRVSPLGIGNFFTNRGMVVLKSELLWIGAPSVIYIIITYFFKRYKKNN